MRIAIAQINTTLGNFQKNSDKILEFIHKAKARHCDLIVFPESTIFGYHPFDMLERENLVDSQLITLQKLFKSVPKDIYVLLGVITKNKEKLGKPYYNSAVLFKKGKRPEYFHKQLLPTGDVFDEARFIEQGDLKNNYTKINGKTVFITICEDIWAWPDKSGRNSYKENPLSKVKKQKTDLVLNLSASPYYPNKINKRKELVKKTAMSFKAPMIYCNLIGAQDEIIFDGGSFAVDKQGKVIQQCITFDEDFGVLDLLKMKGSKNPIIKSEIEEIHKALVLGIRDFCFKTGIKKIHLGLSGGIDSAVVACLACEAIGSSNVTAIALPGPFNSLKSLKYARALANNLNIQFMDVNIEQSYNELKNLVDKSFDLKSFGLVHENLQARIRGLLLMAFANSKNSMLLSTGNKSELATGYSTLYGDMCGGLAPIGDLTKLQVYELANFYNRELEIIPNEIITRAPSAELRPNQKDQDTLPEYNDLDLSVTTLVEGCARISTKTDRWLMPILLKSEFKRWQAPPILKVSIHSFGRGRRWPIAHEAKELLK